MYAFRFSVLCLNMSGKNYRATTKGQNRFINFHIFRTFFTLFFTLFPPGLSPSKQNKREEKIIKTIGQIDVAH